jgi:hypothetical protein
MSGKLKGDRYKIKNIGSLLYVKSNCAPVGADDLASLSNLLIIQVSHEGQVACCVMDMKQYI